MPRNNHNILRWSDWHLKVALFLLSILVCAVIGEVAARAFWQFQYHVPFREPGFVLYAFYPELKMVDTERPSHNDGSYDILFLGGSVLTRQWGTVEQELLEQLAHAGYRNVRIFNVAVTAHTSRDSWLKYSSLGDARFDLVIFYHGINETRANNVLPDLYQEDYSHYSWYEIVNSMALYHRNSSFALPYTFNFGKLLVRQLLSEARYVPTHVPRREWLRYGSTYRSSASFGRHLDAILDLASRRGDRMLLMTFAINVPKNYSYKGFKAKPLDNLLKESSFEIWGKAENVIGAVATHNEIIRRIARKRTDLLFVDQANLMKGSFSFFIDSCHFTGEGASEFVENLLEVLLPALKTGG